MHTTTAFPPERRCRLLRLGLAAAIFFAIGGAKLTVIGRYGTDLPFWDQWAKEGDVVYTPWLERGEIWPNVVSPHNEHRIVPTLLTNLGLLALSGQWDARVQCAFNAALHAALLAGLFLWASARFSWAWTVATAALVTLLGVAPIAWENVLGGFQSSFYFLAGFSLLAIGGIILNPAFSARWWGGVAAGGAALVSMGSGLLAAIPVLAIVGVRLGFGTITRRDAIPTLLAAFSLLLIGLKLHTSVPGHAVLRAQDFPTWTAYAAHCLSWPLVKLTWLGLLLWLPWLGLFFRQMRRLARRGNQTPADRAPDPTADFVLGGGLWILLQIAAVSYSRGGSGELPANRYGDLFALGLFFSGSALAWCARLPRLWPVATVWGLAVVTSMTFSAHQAWTHSLPQKKADHMAFEKNLREFVLTDDLAAFEKQPLPFPNSGWLARILRHPLLRTLLPASVRLPIPVRRFAGDAGETAAKLPFRPTREIASPGEWRSEPIPPSKGWWRIEIRGRLGQPGTSLELVAVPDGRVLASLIPPTPTGDGWQSVFVRAPGVPARLVARNHPPGGAFAFSEPTEVSTLSYRTVLLCQRGTSIFAVAALAGLALAVFPLVGGRPTATESPG